jgi:hypothetical protein
MIGLLAEELSVAGELGEDGTNATLVDVHPPAELGDVSLHARHVFLEAEKSLGLVAS